MVVSLVVVVFLIVVFAAHWRNIHGVFLHGFPHVIDTAAQGLISSSAVVQEGGQEDSRYILICKLLISAIVKLYFRV